MQHINYILGLKITDVEKLELIKCYLEAGVEQVTSGYSQTLTTPGQNWSYGICTTSGNSIQ